VDLIGKVGPGGSYLAEDHTLDHFRSFWAPTILDRSMGCKAGSAVHSEEALRKKTLKLIENHHPEPIEEGLLSEIKKLEKTWFERLDLDHVYPDK
jgi:trimethylamine--corrinoid protein Co-methyltransferase